MARLVLSRVTSLKRLQWNVVALCCLHQDISTMNDTFPTQDTPFSSKRRGRHCAAFSRANGYSDAKGNPKGLHYFSFPKEVQRRNRWCNLIKRQHGKDGFFVTKSTFLCSEHFKKRRHPKNVGRSLGIGERFVIFACNLFCCCLESTVRKPLSRCLLWFLIFGLVVFILWLYPP